MSSRLRVIQADVSIGVQHSGKPIYVQLETIDILTARGLHNDVLFHIIHEAIVSLSCLSCFLLLFLSSHECVYLV